MKAVAKLPIMLKQLKLSSIVDNWKPAQEQARESNWGYDAYLAYLTELELQEKTSKRISRYIKQSGITTSKTLSSFNFSHNKTIPKAQICSLANTSSWVADAHNVVLIGPSGTGKTHLAMALGHGLIEQGIRVLFKTALSLVQELQVAKKNLELSKLISKLNNYQVLIIDDLGYVKKDEIETSAYSQLIDHEKSNIDRFNSSLHLM